MQISPKTELNWEYKLAFKNDGGEERGRERNAKTKKYLW